MTGENAPTTVTTGFDRFGDWLFGKSKTVAKRVAAEAVPGATLIPAVRRQVEADEQKRFNEWYEGLPDGRKARFHEVFVEPGLWAPGQREAIVFNEFRDMPGGPRDRIRNLAMMTTPGMMTYGSAASRIGNLKLAKQMARERGVPFEFLGDLPPGELAKIKKATGYEPGIYGPGVETGSDVRFNAGTSRRVLDTIPYAGDKSKAVLDAASGTISPETLSDIIYGIEGRASELLDIPADVLTAYPKIGGLKVNITPSSRMSNVRSSAGLRVQGASLKDKHSVYIEGPRPGESVQDANRRMLDTLVHEVEHEGQKYTRRINRGSSPEQYATKDGYRRDANEMDARTTAYRRRLSPEERAGSLREDTLMDREGLRNSDAIVDGTDTKALDDMFDMFRRANQDAKGGEASHAAEKSQDYTAHDESTAPTDEQLQEAVEFLHMVLEAGAPQNEWEQSAVQRIVTVLEKALEAKGAQPAEEQPAEEQPAEEQPAEEQPAEEQPAEEQPAEEQPAEEQPAEEQPAEEQPAEVRGDVMGGETEEDVLKRFASDPSGSKSVTEDTTTLEERRQFLAERGMDTDLANYGSMEQLQRMHEEQVGGPQQPAVQQPAVQQPAVQQPAVQQPAVQQPAVQQPAVQQPAVQQPMSPYERGLAEHRAKQALRPVNGGPVTAMPHIGPAPVQSETFSDFNPTIGQVKSKDIRKVNRWQVNGIVPGRGV